MPTLKARIGGAWVPIAGVGSGADEVFIGPNDPGAAYELWYDSDDPGSGMVVVESAVFTPSLNAIAIGTGGSAGNTGYYTFTGGYGVGAVGQMVATGLITFGTSGQTFPGAFPGVALPTGFEYYGHAYNLNVVGSAYYNDAGVAAYFGMLPRHGGANNLALFSIWNTSGSWPNQSNLSTTIPFGWAAGDQIGWTVNALVVRV